MSVKQAQKLVAVVVPLSNRSELIPEEQISLRHLEHFLGKYDKYFVIPKNLQVSRPGFGIKRFDKKFFGSLSAHTKLMLSPLFYKAFIGYKFILIYHLDSLVFSDQLIQWCGMDFDFIGPPWIKHEDAPYAGNSGYEGKVGNGGFSLKKIESFLKVFYSRKYCIEPKEYWDKFYSSKPKYIQYLNFPRKILKRLKICNNARWEMSRYGKNEEHFLANRATHYYPQFKIAPVNVALRFGFECVPRYCFELNKNALPFGCHAWPYYNRDFWESFLLK
jgi:uncharacterized protein DUF5672